MYNITKTVQGIPFLLEMQSLIGAAQARIPLSEIARLINQHDLRVLRRLMERNAQELAEFGDIVIPAMVATNATHPFHPDDVLLNSAQAIYLTSRSETTAGRKLCVLLVKAFAEMLRMYAEHTANGKRLQSSVIPKALPTLDVVNPASLLVQQAKLLHSQALKIADHEETLDRLDTRLLALELSQPVKEPAHEQSPNPGAVPTNAQLTPIPVAPVKTATTNEVPCKNTSNPTSAARYTIRGWANVHKIFLSDRQAQSLGRRASAMCRRTWKKIEKTRDKRWGEVGFYPAYIVQDVFSQFYISEAP